MEVLPFNVRSLRRRAFKEVKRISMHQPVRPHLRKSEKKWRRDAFILRCLLSGEYGKDPGKNCVDSFGGRNASVKISVPPLSLLPLNK